MSEGKKTIWFIGGAVVMSVAAWFSQPRPIADATVEEDTGPMFAQFDDPYSAKSMEIVRLDEDLGNISEFSVAQENGLWVIPSHNDYPADAEDQLKEVASSLVKLKKIRFVSDKEGEHATYGVVEPDEEKVRRGEQGVGTLIVMKDDKDKELASVVVGKEVRDEEGRRYVREAGKPRVYVAEIDPEKFSTKFEDWIEKDLLDISSFDIEHLRLNDYTAQLGLGFQGIAINYKDNSRMSLAWNSDDSEWELEEFKEDHDGELKDAVLAENEEINKEKLNDLKSALDDLEIVDVERKPVGLGEDLKAGKGFMNDQAGAQSLMDKGFYPVQRDGQLELLCGGGEVIARTKDGVEYVLRFGGRAGVEADTGSENRYVFVTTRVHEKSFPYPELEPVPGKDNATETKPLEGQSGQDEISGDENTDSEEDEQVDEQETSPDDSPQPADADAEESTNETTEPAVAEAAPGESTQDTQDEAASDDGESGTEVVSDDAEETVSQETVTDTGESDSAEVTDDSAEEETLEAKIERIQRENQRKLDEYKEKKEEAEKKVNDLNFRFADWYYVVSEDVYKKIRLGRDDVIKKKEPDENSEEGTNAADDTSDNSLGALNALEEEGLSDGEN